MVRKFGRFKFTQSYTKLETQKCDSRWKLILSRAESYLPERRLLLSVVTPCFICRLIVKWKTPGNQVLNRLLDRFGGKHSGETLQISSRLIWQNIRVQKCWAPIVRSKAASFGASIFFIRAHAINLIVSNQEAFIELHRTFGPKSGPPSRPPIKMIYPPVNSACWNRSLLTNVLDRAAKFLARMPSESEAQIEAVIAPGSLRSRLEHNEV